MSIRIGIVGYGNLGRGVELAVRQNPDMELVAVFTRRDPSGVKTAFGDARVRHVENAIDMTDKIDVMILGGGPNRIGQGIEFDYCCVHCVWELKKAGYEAIIANNNPETVSTDFDTADRLYFEPLTPEDVMGVINTEKPIGVVVAFGGQTAIKLTKFLDSQGIHILGTSANSIDLAEDREKIE